MPLDKLGRLVCPTCLKLMRVVSRYDRFSGSPNTITYACEDCGSAQTIPVRSKAPAQPTAA